MRNLFDNTFFRFLVGFVVVIVAGLFLLALMQERQSASTLSGKFCQKSQMCTNA